MLLRSLCLYVLGCVLCLSTAYAQEAQAPQPFGAQIFQGAFKSQGLTGFNPNYQIAVGDLLTVRLWGAFEFEGDMVVDPQGNVFLPKIGPINVLGITNSKLNSLVNRKVRGIYTNNVQAYAALKTPQPVKVFVAGNVKKPGLYAGLSFDSILHYIDKADGVDPARGSYRKVQVMRAGVLRKTFDLYDYLLTGKLELIQLSDGDTIFVPQRAHTVTVSGDVYNAFEFEIVKPEVSVEEILSYAGPKATATDFEILHKSGKQRSAEYYALSKAPTVMTGDGDEVIVKADKSTADIIIRIHGENIGNHSLVLPYGAKLSDAMPYIIPSRVADIDGLQIFRTSLAKRQKEMLQESIRKLEEQSLTARSETNEEAQLRVQEAKLISEFVEKAKEVEPKGQIVLGDTERYDEVILQNEDLIIVPKKTNLVLLHGEVMFPTAHQYDGDMDIEDYVELSGGFSQQADSSRLLVMSPNGRFRMASAGDDDLQPGDEVFILPEVSSKNIEIARGVTEILYQMAVAARIFVAF